MYNKVLNIIAWILFLLSVVSYAVTEIPVEAIYLCLSACFLITVPRTLDD